MKKIFSSLIISMLMILSAATIVSAENIPPVADAGGPYEGFTGENITFDGSSSVDPDGNNSNLTYTWNFGDGNKILVTGKIVNYSYSEHGVYTVNLTVTDEDGNETTDSTTATIKAKPIADFSYSPEKPKPETDIIFDASACDDPDGNNSNLTYEWNLGDGTTRTNISFSHNYTDEGDYQVTLVVTDEEGYNNTAEKTISVVNNSPPDLQIIKPIENLTYIYGLMVGNRIKGSKPFIIGSIKIQAIVTDDNEIKHVKFYIDDEEQATIDEPKKDTNIYQWRWGVKDTLLDKKGNYTIKVVAFDSHNVTAEREIEVQHFQSIKVVGWATLAAVVGVSINTIKNLLSGRNEAEDESPDDDMINQAPTAMINASSSVKVNEELTLDASESSDDKMIVSYDWDLGDGTNISGETITHKYKESGKYTVTLVVTDEEGEQDSMTMTINVEKTKDSSKGTPGFGITTFMLVITLFAAIAIYKKKH
jgi:PKD repeat protein